MTGWETVAAAARRLGVSRQAVHKRIDAGRLVAWTLPGRNLTRVRSTDVEKWRAERVGREWRANGEVTT